LVLLHTYITLTLVPKGVAEVSQIFLQDTHVLPKLVSYKEHCRRDIYNNNIIIIYYYIIIIYYWAKINPKDSTVSKFFGN
jgi:hypothetical protein